MPDWSGADGVVNYFAAHPELNITAKYSTPSEFYKEMHACNNTSWEIFQPPDNDFFLLVPSPPAWLATPRRCVQLAWR